MTAVPIVGLRALTQIKFGDEEPSTVVMRQAQGLRQTVELGDDQHITLACVGHRPLAIAVIATVDPRCRQSSTAVCPPSLGPPHKTAQPPALSDRQGPVRDDPATVAAAAMPTVS